MSRYEVIQPRGKNRSRNWFVEANNPEDAKRKFCKQFGIETDADAKGISVSCKVSTPVELSMEGGEDELPAPVIVPDDPSPPPKPEPHPGSAKANPEAAAPLPKSEAPPEEPEYNDPLLINLGMPEDLLGKLEANGITTWEQLPSTEKELVALEGIGEVTAGEILQFIKDRS